MTKMARINTPFMTKTAKNHTLSGRTYLESPYEGVPREVLQGTIKEVEVSREPYNRSQV